MAARSGESVQEVIALRYVEADSLGELFEEEVRRWRSRLHWDFGPSAGMIRRYVAMQALEGVALVEGKTLGGYCYWVTEQRKTLLGDFYVRDAWRTPRNEQFLLEQALAAIRGERFAHPRIVRIEGQLMQMDLRASEFGRQSLVPRSWARDFMLAPLKDVHLLPPARLPASIRLVNWSFHFLDPAAELMEESYRGHVDSVINDQYHTAAGARRFLQNIIQYPGCGRFAPECSWVALDAAGRVRGIAATTIVAPGTGHIAQVCVGPEVRSIGLGYELMRRSMLALAAEDCFEVSLTVTAENTNAVQLYLRLGFRVIHEFDALVWEPDQPSASPAPEADFLPYEP